MTTIFHQFRRSDRGNVAIIFGLAAMPLLLVTGAAVDYSRAGEMHSRLQAATDSAVLALCQEPATATVADMKAKAQRAIRAFVNDQTAAVTTPVVTNNPRAVTLTATQDYDTAFMKIVRQTTMAIGATASCQASENFFEVALVLDTTGSMSSTSGSKSKMEAAKDAATSFISYMFATGAKPGHLKMSLVPFAASVAVNPSTYKNATWLDTSVKSSKHWQYVTGATAAGFTNRLSIFDKLKTQNAAWGWAGCLESLPHPLNTEDGTPSSSNGDGYFLPLLAPDEVSNTKTCSLWGYTYECQDATAANSYLDDGTGTSGSCANNGTAATRLRQACKYKTPTKVRTGEAGPNWTCTSRALSRAGTAEATLKTEVAALQPSGSTNIHEGFMWGWRTVSPTSVFGSDVSAYGTPNTTKVIVLMTDGMNEWKSSNVEPGRSNYSAYGYFRNADGTSNTSRFPAGTVLSTTAEARTAIDKLLLESCGKAKAKDVQIYTVGFSTEGDPIDAQGLSLLEKCSSGTGYNFVANDASGIITAFEKIAKGIGQLRLTN